MIDRYNDNANDDDVYLASFDNPDVASLQVVPVISDVVWSTLTPAWWIDECLECIGKERTTEWM